jgi:C-terminal peptidase prc
MTIFYSLLKKLAGTGSGVLLALMASALVLPLLPLAACHPENRPASAASFNGKAVYQKAFEVLRDNHYTLINPAARAAFAAKWEHKHDNDKALSTERGTDTAVDEMMWSLGQRFDYYLPPADTKSEHEEEAATMVGIGVSVKQGGLARAIKALGDKPTAAQLEPLQKLSADRPLVVTDEPVSDTPAGKAHLEEGDCIVAVEGDSVYGKTMDEVVPEIRGPVGTKVVLTIARKDASGKVTTSKVSVIRAQIAEHVIKTDYEGSIAHIRMSNFLSQFGAEEMAKAAKQAAQNSTGIILDLRGNPGGSLEQVLNIAQMYIPRGVILKEVARSGDHMITITYSVTHDSFVATSQSDDGSPAQVSEEPRSPLLVPAKIPVVVLIDEGSASASELLSGALQANGRVRVIGQPSRGKGVGQIVVPLPFDRTMHVTNFEFFPGGVKMDWVGIVPDIEVQLPDGVELLNDASTDTQLKAAKLELIEDALGNPTKAASQAQLDARRAALEKKHRAAFQEEMKERQYLLTKAAADAAKGNIGTTSPKR